MHLYVPRVVDDSESWIAIKKNDMKWFKRAITTRSILPTDIAPDGDNLILLALSMWNMSVAQFLYQQGFSTRGTSSTGW
ncbi:hypothetical protein BR93DRAFT_163802 [Coniochaeta sp. PMI_546]|nr:hypothetical protein BR93DRAFT_163802 [Coniochaeta sp. PMI_546]